MTIIVYVFWWLFKGCDGLILLGDTSSFLEEKTTFPNVNSVRGFDVIGNIKTTMEFPCPGVVCCVDILAIAARDSVVILGRRDAKTASLAAANKNIPPTSNLNELISRFSAFGLSTRDMVALSGLFTHSWTSKMHHLVYNETNVDSSFAQTR
ncbi:unnamed protein product [Camellia sinensis]